MDDQRRLALRALALVQGQLEGNRDSVSLLHEAFDTLEEAAEAYAYLSGFLLQVLSQSQNREPVLTAAWFAG